MNCLSTRPRRIERSSSRDPAMSARFISDSTWTMSILRWSASRKRSGCRWPSRRLWTRVSAKGSTDLCARAGLKRTLYLLCADLPIGLALYRYSYRVQHVPGRAIMSHRVIGTEGFLLGDEAVSGAAIGFAHRLTYRHRTASRMDGTDSHYRTIAGSGQQSPFPVNGRV